MVGEKGRGKEIERLVMTDKRPLGAKSRGVPRPGTESVGNTSANHNNHNQNE